MGRKDVITKEKSLVLVAVRVMEEMTGMKIEKEVEEEKVKKNKRGLSP